MNASEDENIVGSANAVMILTKGDFKTFLCKFDRHVNEMFDFHSFCF